MALKRLQNRVAESHYALLGTALYTLLIWYMGAIPHAAPLLEGGIPTSLAPRLEVGGLVSVVLFGISTYLMMQLNNANALIRIYSRMVSCSFMMISLVSLYAVARLDVALVMLCFITFLLTIFNTYQDNQASGWTFYAFVCIGLASTIFPQIVFLVPFLWMFLGFLLMAMSHRTFWASVLGLLLPYWFILPYCLLRGDMSFLTSLLGRLTTFQPLFQYDGIAVSQLVSFGITVLLALIGTVHFLRNSFRDKIRTRMFFHIFIYLSLLLTVFIILQPQHFDMLIGLLAVTTSPLTGHFVALTRTRTTNVAFCLLTILVVAATLLNILAPHYQLLTPNS